MIPHLSDIDSVYFPLFMAEPGNLASMPLLATWADFNDINIIQGPTFPNQVSGNQISTPGRPAMARLMTVYYGECDKATYKKVFGKEYDLFKLGPEIEIVQDELKELVEGNGNRA